MEPEFSTPLTALPSFLSTISMVSDDRSAIIRGLIRAEQKSPPRYDPARNLFLYVLEGKLSLKQATEQARRILDLTERKCALEILNASSDFLRNGDRSRVGLFPVMSVLLPNDMELNISPVWLRHLSPNRLMVLHFWKNPLLGRQVSAAAAVLRKALAAQQPEYLRCELDFISIALPMNASVRRFECFNWARAKPLPDNELDRFWKPFCDAWLEYVSREPREKRGRRDRGLFDHSP
jgi:hypothetical protein